MNVCIKPWLHTGEPMSSQKINISHTCMVFLAKIFDFWWASQTSSSVYLPPRSTIVAASLSMHLAMGSGRGCCKFSAADHWKLVRLILLLMLLVCVFTVTGWSVAVQGVLRSIDDAWHADPAQSLACEPGTTNHSMLCYRIFPWISVLLPNFQ